MAKNTGSGTARDNLGMPSKIKHYRALAKLEGRDIGVAYEGHGGLYMKFTPAGGCSWRFRYRPRQLGPTGQPLNPTSETIGPLHLYDAEAAIEIAKAMELLVRDGKHPSGWQYNPKEDPTVRDVFNYYLEVVKTPKTIATYRSICQYLLAEIADLKVADLKRRMLKDVMEKHYTTRPHAGRNAIAVMKRAFQTAEDELSLLNVPPERHMIWDKLWHYVPEIKHREFGTYKVSFSADEWAKLDQGFEKAYADPHIRQGGLLALEFMMNTGCRTSEAEGLKWSEIQPEVEHVVGGRTYRVGRATKMAHKTFGRTGKPRVILLAEGALDVLRRAKALRERIGYTGPFVFPSQGKRNGNPEAQITAQYFAKKLAQHAGLPDIKPYHFRSGYINRTVDQMGEEWLPIVSQNVGHASVETTRKWYRKQAEDRLIAGAVRADQAMKTKSLEDPVEDLDDLFDGLEEDEYEPVD